MVRPVAAIVSFRLGGSDGVAVEARKWRGALEALGFDGAMLNAHHATPFCMGGGVMNMEAAILARITERLKIVLLGNVLPIWDDPLALAEELAFIDLVSRGRLVSGIVRGTGRESVASMFVARSGTKFGFEKPG